MRKEMRVPFLAAAAVVLGACAAGSSGRFVDVDDRTDGDVVAYQAPSRPGESITLRRIGTYTSTGLGEPRRLVIRTDAEWRDFWSDLGGGALPAVDFSRDMVIGVASGTRRTTGYGIRVDAVHVDDDGTLVIDVVETAPGANCFNAQQVTRPADVIVVPRAERGWTFRERTETVDC